MNRPNIPKLKITKIGSFSSNGNINNDWVFDGKSHPKSVGNYFSKDWVLYGGYTIEELREISKGVNNDE